MALGGAQPVDPVYGVTVRGDLEFPRPTDGAADFGEALAAQFRERAQAIFRAATVHREQFPPMLRAVA
jgi:hypothetical protein